MMSRSVFVVQRRSFDVASPLITSELREEGVLGPKDVAVRARRYDINWERATPSAQEICDALVDPAEELSASTYPQLRTLCSTGDIWRDDDPSGRIARGEPVALAVAYHEGQFDQRADAAEQVLRMRLNVRARVRVVDLYLCFAEGEVRYHALVDHLVNPVDSQSVDPVTDERVEGSSAGAAAHPGRPAIERPAFLEGNPSGTSMSEADREFAAAWFRRQQRAPTETELGILDTYWSDHCRHSTFNTELQLVDPPSSDLLGAVRMRETLDWVQRERERLGRTGSLTLMELATIVMRSRAERGRLSDVVLSDEVNACTLRVETADGPWLVLFKNETHNHPTEIEPYGGAATCLGGAIRDPLSGRAYVYQALRISGSADPRPGLTPRIEGRLTQARIAREAARGYSSYGNQIGVATGLVDELYHPGYQAKRLEMGAVVGSVAERHVRRETPAAGDRVMLVGGRTGRDGVGGATGSSRSHDRTSIDRAGAEVQKGNPPVERALQRLFRRREFTQRVKRSNDFGAGGVAVAVGEIAEGLEISLDRVPLKYAGLGPTEVALSESQERMAIVVEADHVSAVIALAAEEDLEATEIARVTDDLRVRMLFGGVLVADLARDLLDSGGAPRAGRYTLPVADEHELAHAIEPPRDLASAVGRLAACSRLGLSERFDSSIGARTLLAHAEGTLQRTPVGAMAARISASGPASDIASVMSWGFDPELSAAWPYAGAYAAVVESVVRVCAAGGTLAAIYLSLQEYFPRPGADPARWGLPVAALLGAVQAQLDLGVAAIGGKDSMSGTFEEIDVPPTLISVALATTPASAVRPGHALAPQHRIVLAPVPTHPDGVPDAARAIAAVSALERLGPAALSARAVRPTGLLNALAEYLFGEGLGFTPADRLDQSAVVQRAGTGSLIVELADSDLALPSDWVELGRTTADGIVRWGSESLETDALYRVWSAPLDAVYRASEADAGRREFKLPTRVAEGTRSPVASAPSRRAGRVRVVIPVFDGTNCEDDLCRAFERAGAKPQRVLIRSRSGDHLESSIAEFARLLRDAHILALPGGFSAADEPGGSGKFIAAVLSAPPIRAAVEAHFLEGERLMLGICNGFQGLVRTGLVPYGRYLDSGEQRASLAPNAIGRHVSMHVRLRLAECRSPWTQGLHAGEIFAEPVSHGEGRFTASSELIDQLLRDGQVVTQYVDWHGQIGGVHPFNPNGSQLAIEGICSPDGRFLGKMGHTERREPGLDRHIPAERILPLFQNGVAWFG